MSNNDTEDQKAEHTSIQAPKFRPAVWFQQIEAQFVCKGITKDNLKYCHALQALDTDIVAKVSDFTINPPQYGKYKAFKTRVLHTFQDSEEKYLKTLLYQAELGDQRPSCFLKHLKELAEGKASDELLKSLWTQRLPLNMQIILAACGDDLDKLAILVDRIHDIAAPNVSSLEVAATPPPRHHCRAKSTRLQEDSITSPRQDKEQTHVGVVDRAAARERDQHHQAVDTVGITGVSTERPDNVSHSAVGRTKTWKTNCRSVTSAKHPGHKYAPFIRY